MAIETNSADSSPKPAFKPNHFNFDQSNNRVVVAAYKKKHPNWENDEAVSAARILMAKAYAQAYREVLGPRDTAIKVVALAGLALTTAALLGSKKNTKLATQVATASLPVAAAATASWVATATDSRKKMEQFGYYMEGEEGIFEYTPNAAGHKGVYAKGQAILNRWLAQPAKYLI